MGFAYDRVLKLQRIAAALAEKAGLPKPGAGIPQLALYNAFAFSKTQSDGRIRMTQGILGLLSKVDLKAVIG